jgi:hypothetical protein
MKRYISLFIAAIITFAAFCQTDGYTLVKASDRHFAYVGRISFRNPDAPSFTYPGVQIHANFSGTSVKMATKAGSGYFMIELDDKTPYKVESTKDDSTVLIAEGLNDTMHRLTITYAIEGLLMKPEFRGLYLDKGHTLGTKPKLPTRIIEFIGNSITCGYGIEGQQTDKGFSYSKQNEFYTYEALASRALNAQCWVVARSGIGIYRNCRGKLRGDRGNMQDVYPFTNFGTGGERWDFSRCQPDVVCVNLGTNDTTAPKYDPDLLTNAFKRFISTLRSHYPKAKIILLTGTMISGKRLADLQQAQLGAIADAANRGDNNVFRLDFTPADGSLGYGTFKHPSMKQHEQMANELVPFIKKITGWK